MMLFEAVRIRRRRRATEAGGGGAVALPMCGGGCDPLAMMPTPSGALRAVMISFVALLFAAHTSMRWHDDDSGRRTAADDDAASGLGSGRSLLQMPFFGATTIDNDYPYAVIIISYHKTGVSCSICSAHVVCTMHSP